MEKKLSQKQCYFMSFPNCLKIGFLETLKKQVKQKGHRLNFPIMSSQSGTLWKNEVTH